MVYELSLSQARAMGLLITHLVYITLTATYLKSRSDYSKGFFGNTFIATHNIQAHDDFVMATINFAGVDLVCDHAQSANLEKKPNFNGSFTTDSGRQSESRFHKVQTIFNHIFPTNICGEANNKFNNQLKLSNISLLAGHSPSGTYDDQNQAYTDYVGGQIQINKSVIMGTILAGNNFINGANASIVWGNLLTLNNDCDTNHADGSCPNSNLIQKTSIQFRELPDTYSVNVVPEVTCPPDPVTGAKSANCQYTKTVYVQSNVKWARFK